jgi:hypothetical protein
MSILRWAIVGAAAMFAPGAASVPSLVGTYRLISAKEVVVATGEVKPFGTNSMGYITYGADGRMMTLLGDKDRPTLTFTDKVKDEGIKARLYDTMGGYGGTYTFDGAKVVHHIDIATRPAVIGTDAVRYVEFRGNRLIYTTKPGPSPRSGAIVTFEDVWERVPDGYLAPRN